MGERFVLQEQNFGPVYRINGHVPPAPEEAVNEYGRLKREWQKRFYIPGVEPVVQLYPSEVNEEYVIYTVVTILLKSA